METTEITGLSHTESRTNLRQEWATSMLEQMGVKVRILETHNMVRKLMDHLITQSNSAFHLDRRGGIEIPQGVGLVKEFCVESIKPSGFTAKSFRDVLTLGKEVWENEAKNSKTKSGKHKAHAEQYGHAIEYLNTRDQKYRKAYERVVSEQEKIAVAVTNTSRYDANTNSTNTPDEAYRVIHDYTQAALSFGLNN